jgi:hypothetical protein
MRDGEHMVPGIKRWPTAEEMIDHLAPKIASLLDEVAGRRDLAERKGFKGDLGARVIKEADEAIAETDRLLEGET